MLFLLKILYFRRKHIEKHTFPLVIATFLLYLQRMLLNSCMTIIIGRENEQRELCKLHGSSILLRSGIPAQWQETLPAPHLLRRCSEGRQAEDQAWSKPGG